MPFDLEKFIEDIATDFAEQYVSGDNLVEIQENLAGAIRQALSGKAVVDAAHEVAVPIPILKLWIAPLKIAGCEEYAKSIEEMINAQSEKSS